MDALHYVTEKGKASYRSQRIIKQGWASVLFKRTQRSCVLLCSLLKNAAFFAFFCILYKRTRRSLGSFMFFIKDCGVLCVPLLSLWKNAAFFAFFYVLYKRMQRSSRSFMCFIKEPGVIFHSFTFFKKERGVLF